MESDRLTDLELPADDRLQLLAHSIESLMEHGKPAAVQSACTEFMAAAANFYGVSKPAVRAPCCRS